MFYDISLCISIFPMGEKWDIMHQYADYTCRNRCVRAAPLTSNALDSTSFYPISWSVTNWNISCLYFQIFDHSEPLLTNDFYDSTFSHSFVFFWLLFSSQVSYSSLITEHPVGKCASPHECPALWMLATVNNSSLSCNIPVSFHFIKDEPDKSVVMCGWETYQKVAIGMTNSIHLPQFV